jgi:hypothetical protein
MVVRLVVCLRSDWRLYLNLKVSERDAHVILLLSVVGPAVATTAVTAVTAPSQLQSKFCHLLTSKYA